MNSIETLRSRYALAQSRFLTLNDIPVHYTDEGEGPVIVLVHGSFLDLTSWDSWLQELQGYRIVRYDRLRWGLTGHGEGEAIGYEDEEALLAALVDHLGLERFALAGTSSGGMVVASYAAHHPQRVDRLILINFPLGHGRIQNAGGDSTAAAPEPSGPGGYMRGLLERNFVDVSLVTDELVARLAEMSDREDPTGAVAASYAHASRLTEAERAATLGQISAPTLVMWSGENRTLPVANGEAAFKAVGAEDKQFVVIERAGHMLPLEQGELSSSVARRFLDGARVPASVGQ
jgi:pimeloyl-ACP methyl ester carboxylesterase